MRDNLLMISKKEKAKSSLKMEDNMRVILDAIKLLDSEFIPFWKIMT